MKRLVERFGRLTAASFVVMAIGIVLFLLTIPLYATFGIDTDLIGLTIFVTGLAICAIGTIRRKELRGWKFAVLAILAAVLTMPVLILVVTTIYFLITGNPVG